MESGPTRPDSADRSHGEVTLELSSAPTIPAAPQLLEGEVLAGRYCIRRFVARGGGGEVYEAEDLELGVRLALKTLSAGDGLDGGRAERFRREIQLARRVTHANVCRLYDFGRHVRRSGEGNREVLFLTMELLSGPTLAQYLIDGGPLSPQEGLPLVRQMAAALDAAHRAGVVHRDFKSGNVLLVPDAEGPGGMRAVVTDFGLARGHLAKESSPTVTAAGLIVGSPAYMAPEQVEGGQITPAADLYAFGVVLYEMSTGAFPFTGDSALSIAVKRLREEPVKPSERNPDVDPRWERVILRCLERDPKDRFPDALAIATALEPSAPMPRGRRLRASRLVAWSGAALLVAGLAWASRYYFGGRPQEAAGGARSGAAAIAARPAVAVLGFENLNRNADSDWLATALAEMLDAELSAGGALRVVSGETVARVRKEMGLERALALSPETLALLRANLLAEHILTGSYITQGPRGSERLRLVLRLQSATTGETESISGEDSIDQLFRLADGVGDALRSRLGLAAATASDQAASPAVVPRDTEAARTYSEGLTHLRDRDLLVARELLEKAVRLDADNAAAHSALAEVWFLQGYDKKALAEAKKAFDRSAELTGEGRLLIEARFRALSRDWDRAINLYSSLWTMEPDDPEHIERLARTQLLATKWKDALSTLESAYGANPPLSDEPSLALLEGEVRQRLSDFPGALAAARRALATASPRGARLLVARAHHGEGQALLSLGSQAEARAAFERSRDLYREIGDREGEALSSRSLAVVLRQTGSLDEAYRIGAEALRTLREMGNQRHAVTVLNTLANIRYDQSRLDDAARLYDEILAIGRETEDLRAQAAALGNLGNVYFLRGDLGRAISSHREALRFKREMGDRSGTATTLISLAVPLLDHVEPAQAVAHLEEALGLAREIGSKGIEATALHVLAETRFHTGDVAAAQSLFETARTAQRELGDASRADEAALWLLLVDLDQRRFAAVREGAVEVIRASQELEAPNLEAAARAALAQADAALGLAVDARREAATARRLAENDEDLSLRWSTLAQALRAEGAVDAIEGSSERARRALQRLGDDASARGFTRHGFEIQLMVEELALADGDADAAQRLEALSDRARRAGFGRVSERARDLAQRRTLPLGQAVSSPSMSRPG